ncbi:MAG: aspartate aminotransferase, partial [Deltaproteobacteria bacterium CG_4_9_14_3_um_filter_63_12]
MKAASRLSLVKESETLALTTRARQMTRAGRDMVNFGVGEPDFDTPAHIVEAAKRALDQGQTRYSAVGGLPVLREAIAVRYQRRYGIRTTAANVMVSVGGKHVLFNLAMALL